MPFLLRSTKYNRWMIAEPEWLIEGEIPADPIFGLDTKSNKMSVWVVDNNGAYIERIVGALAAKGQTLQDFEYVLLNLKTVASIGIKILQIAGRCPDKDLNKLHRDLDEISGQKLLKVTQFTVEKLLQGEANLVDRIPRKTVAKYIQNSINKGFIDPVDITPNVLEKAQSVLEKGQM